MEQQDNQNIQKAFLIPQEMLFTVIKYLETQPLGNIYGLYNALNNLKEVEIKKTIPINTVVEPTK